MEEKNQQEQQIEQEQKQQEHVGKEPEEEKEEKKGKKKKKSENSKKLKEGSKKVKNAVISKFQKDFFKYSLITIWAITIIFILVINLPIITNLEGSYASTSITDEFKAFDITKIALEVFISIPMMAAIALIFFARRTAHKIGIITSTVIIFQSMFVMLLYSVYDGVSASGIGTIAFDPNRGWNSFRHILLEILHIIVIVMILIDMRKTNKAGLSTENKTNVENVNVEEHETQDVEDYVENYKEDYVENYKEENVEMGIDTNTNPDNNKSQDENLGTSLSTEDLSALDELSKMEVSEDDDDDK